MVPDRPKTAAGREPIIKSISKERSPDEEVSFRAAKT